MDFITIGSIMGIISSIIHAGQGTIKLMRHLKIQSTCCNLKSSFEIDVGSPVIIENNNGSQK